MGVEGGQDHPHAYREGPAHVEPLERSAPEAALGELADEGLPRGPVQGGKVGRAIAAGRLVEARQHLVPGVSIVGHVGVLVPVQATGGELLVDHLGDGHPRVGVVGHAGVAERPHRRRLSGGEEGEGAA